MVLDDSDREDAQAVCDALMALTEGDLADELGLVELLRAREAALPDGLETILRAVDDCHREVFDSARLEIEMEQLLRYARPLIATAVLHQPDYALQSEPRLLLILDELVNATSGWSASLGRAGQKLYDEVHKVIHGLRANDADEAAALEHVRTFFRREQARITKLEERLIASETGLMRSQQSKVIATSTVNDAINDSELTPDLLAFLTGPWYDSLQLIVLRNGLDSDDWTRARKLTETLVQSWQPIDPDAGDAADARQRLYRIAEFLPAELRELLISLEHDPVQADEAMAVVEDELLLLVSGQELEYVEFEMMETDDDTPGSSRPKASRQLVQQIDRYQAGQWFVFEGEEAQVRIKLVLKLDDVRQVMFTNRNGMKVMQCDFDELAYYLSSDIIQPLRHEAAFTSTFQEFFQGVLDEFDLHEQAMAAARAAADREAEEREAARVKAAQEAAEAERRAAEEERERRARKREETLQHAREEAEKAENQEKVKELTRTINDLAIGAWLRLPDVDGELVDAKLAVRITASDKMIFVTGSGAKVGDYSTRQLVELLVGGSAEIKDEGVVFEDTLAQVVSRLRTDRTRSFDDLTGSE